MMSRSLWIHILTIDCDDARLVAEFWRDLLGYEFVPNHTDSIAATDPQGVGLSLLFTWAGRDKRTKNLLHLDLRPTDQPAAVARAIDLGAQHAEIGQEGDESWVVLRDPEGNEFCILQSIHDLQRWESAAPRPGPSIGRTRSAPGSMSD